MDKAFSKMNLGRLIVVDDEAELLSALCEMLAGQGFETTGFTSPQEALKDLKEREYDVLLTDLMMPGMDGTALFEAALECDPNLIGIIMTGQGTVKTAVESMRIGAFDYIMKPFKVSALLPILSKALEFRRLRMENVQLKETVAIHELGQAIAFTSDLNSILNKVADAALVQCMADELSIMLPTQEGDELYVAVARGNHLLSQLGTRTSLRRGIAGWVASNREPIVLKGKVDDERFAPVKPRADIYAAVSMPMMAGGKLVGVLNVSSTKSSRSFTLGQVKALSILISIVAPILENTSLYNKIQEAEERYRSIFDNAVDGIALADAETGVLAACNQALCLMVEREKTELVGQAQSSLHPPQEQTDGVSPSFLKHQKEDAGQTLEDILLSKSGALIPVEIRAARIALNGRDYILGIFRDITERKKAEEDLLATIRQLQETRDMLIQSEKLAALGQLSAGVAHEIRNPINVISMRLQFMQMTETLSEKAKEALNICSDQVKRVTKITNDLSQFSRISSKEESIENLNTIIEHVLNISAPRFKVESVQSDIRLQEDLPSTLLVRDRVEQVILNLISNAMDAMSGRKEKMLRIVTEKTSSEDGVFLRLVVADNGTGIEEEKMDKLFDPFFTTKEPGKGTGLGLSISHGIINDHEGRIWAENNEWGGASFFIELPVKERVDVEYQESHSGL
jgi:PAS domain S-box-containing protein